MKTYVEIIINSEALDIDRPFTYEIDDNLKKEIIKGQLVKVPFGLKNKLVDGFVVEIKQSSKIEGARIKKVKSISVQEPVLNNFDLEMIKFLRSNYLCKSIDAIKLLIPYGVLKGIKKKSKRVVTWNDSTVDKDFDDKYADIITFIKKNNAIYTKAELIRGYKFSQYRINKLIELGVLSIEEVVENRYNNRIYENFSEKKLTNEQVEAINKILSSEKKVALLKGVTGSGKTEVYMKLVENNLWQGKTSVVLVPEIALTPQMIERFKGRFGKDVALFHSRLSDGERFDEWHRVKEGKAKVVVGARSAIFLPAKNIGLIIIDEEHENTYKSEQNPKYNTREVAEFICRIRKCKLVLGSATPSIESYYKALSGEYELVELNYRVDRRSMPQIELVDMRDELEVGNISLFSRMLYNDIKRAINRKEQVILFLNRRGFSTFVSCRKCGYVFKCPVCDISMTYHKNGFLMCHYCGKAERQRNTCPKCESKYVKFFGAGTQRVEEEVKKYFKDTRVLRMDVDTTRTKNSHEKIYNSFKNGEADILIGTQMIAKGLDFPNVTLVGVLAADMSLNIPDYRASEKTFQTITQVSGRAGRGSKEGKVIVQTYTPEHYSLLYAKRYDYEGFYNEEFMLRGIMKYPPFGRLLLINFISKNENRLKEFIFDVAKVLRQEKEAYLGVDMLGPTPCIVSKIKENYRWQILFKGEVELEFCEKVKNILYELNKNVYNEIRVSIDINPNSLV